MAETNTKNERLSFEDALTEAVGIRATAEARTETTKNEVAEPSGEMLETASQYLDSLKVQDPIMADLQIKIANQWKLVETAISPEDLSKLTKSSLDIQNQQGGREFLQNVSQNIEDKELIVSQLETIFNHNAELSDILSSKPGLKKLWYDHLYWGYVGAVFYDLKQKALDEAEKSLHQSIKIDM